MMAAKAEVISEDEWRKIKMSDVRLKGQLMKEGYDKDMVAAVTREELLEMYAECVAEKKNREIRIEQEEARRQEELKLRREELEKKKREGRKS
jgi:hypothetical protein